MKKLLSVRRSQLVSTYGVGALVAAEDASYMVCGVDRWPVDPDQMLHEPRLEKQLRLKGFQEPPSLGEGRDVPTVRFPEWYFCPNCHRLDLHNSFGDKRESRCTLCEVQLVPSRFIVACSAGHADDFPYFNWVHKGKTIKGAEHRLSIQPLGKSAGLEDLLVSCSCGIDRPMQGAFAKDALRGVSRCKGSQPWLLTKADGCTHEPRTLQRGASNFWFPISASSISIPPWSQAAYALLDRNWSVWKSLPAAFLKPALEEFFKDKGITFAIDDLVQVVLARRSGDDQNPDVDLRKEEYDALLKTSSQVSRADLFVCVPASGIPEELSSWIDTVMRVERLREIRALTGFTRLYPQHAEEAPVVATIFQNDPEWRPAIEVNGEGVFIRFIKRRVEEWEARPQVHARVDRIRRHSGGQTYLTEGGADALTARRLLIHTFAHMLLNQWSLDCGYPAAALRERLYCSDFMCGFMIYTASSDAAGSLGGVVAQSEPDRLRASFLGALERGAWCSSDPLCIEADAQGTNNVNLAACHACVLLPEVSCEQMNGFLDRALVVGTPEDPSVGFFSTAIGT